MIHDLCVWKKIEQKGKCDVSNLFDNDINAIESSDEDKQKYFKC